MRKILAVIGARPQFIKHAPVELALSKLFNVVTIHTGQHYDANMSDIFFSQLGISEPSYKLQVGSGAHGAQTGKMMMDIEAVVLTEQPDAVLVYGDTNSTLAGALVAAKLCIPIIHIEAGLRSFNRGMPEEINRILTDMVSHILFAPTQEAVRHLAAEGIKGKVFQTGDVMGDMLLIAQQHLTQLHDSPTTAAATTTPYYYSTLHRPYNTDDPARLAAVLNALNRLRLPVWLATHPRTFHKMEAFGLHQSMFPNIRFSPPVSYFENIQNMVYATAIITDSGGLQKEAYILRKKCVTLRSETEWVETLEGGWNTLVFEHLETLQTVLDSPTDTYHLHLYGKGDAATEICELINTHL